MNQPQRLKRDDWSGPTNASMSSVEDVPMMERKVQDEDTSMMERKVQDGDTSLWPFFSSFILFAVEGALAWFVPIKLSEFYDWKYAILHGFCAPFYWVASFMKEHALAIALIHSDSYMIFWWISFIIGLLLLLRAIKNIFS